MNSSYCNYYESSSLFHGSLLNIMGTRFDIVAVGGTKTVSESLWNEIISELVRLDKMLNRYDKESDIALINARAIYAPVKVTPEMWNILSDCKQYYDITCGLFDITLKDFSQVYLNESDKSVFFLQDNISFDVGGYAKGYAMEKIKALLSFDIEHAFVNFGNSSVLGLGHHPCGDYWSVCIENPYRAGDILGTVQISNNSLSTSGNMPSHPKHIIHPISGEYIEKRQIVCVVTPNSVDAEILSTTLILANDKERADILSRFQVNDIRIYNNIGEENTKHE